MTLTNSKWKNVYCPYKKSDEITMMENIWILENQLNKNLHINKDLVIYRMNGSGHIDIQVHVDFFLPRAVNI